MMSIDNLNPVSENEELFEPLTGTAPDPEMLAQLPASLKERLLFDPLVREMPEKISRTPELSRVKESKPVTTVAWGENCAVERTPSIPASMEGVMHKAMQALRQVFSPDELQTGRAELSEQRDTILQAEVLPEKPKKYAPKPLELARKLTGMIRFACFEGQLYTFDASRGYYKPVTRDDVQRLAMALLERELEIRGTANQLREIYEFIRHDPRIQVTSRPPEQMLCFANGVLDTVTGEFVQGHNSLYFFTWRLAISYNPVQQACPVFDSLIAHVTGGDLLLAERLLQALAYLLMPSKRMRDVILFQGVPGSGKSALANLIASFFDPESMTSLSAKQLQDKFAPYQLVGKRLNLCLDLPKGKLTADSVAFLKQVTGGDAVNVEPKGIDGWSVHLECRFLFGSNHQFAPADEDGGLTERVRLIPFRFSVPPENRDHGLLDKLLLERPAIFNRLLQAFCRLRANNFIFAGEKQYGIEYAGIDAGGAFGDFILERCELASDATTPTGDLYYAFCRYCHAHGFSFNGNPQMFSRSFKAALPECVKHVKMRIDGVPRNCYVGIKLLNDKEEQI